MALPKLWSKLEDDGDVTSPQLGTGGAIVGTPTYEACKFNNGILLNSNTEDINFPCAANSINNSKGAIGFWVKPNFTQTHDSHHCLWHFLDTANGGILFRHDRTNDDWYAIVYSGGVARVICITAGETWSIDDLIHIGFTWDREGNDIGDSKTVAIYINNVEKASSTTTWDADTVTDDIHFGRNQANSNYANATIDNIKTYDVCKTDWSDRGYEGIEEFFGLTVKGPNEAWFAKNYIVGSKYQSGSAGTLEKMVMYCGFKTSDTNVKLAIYKADLTLLTNGVTDEVTIVSGMDGNIEFVFSTPPTVEAATDYWLCWNHDESFYQYWATGASNQVFYKDATYDVWPSPLGTPTYQNRKYTIFAVYGEEGPPPAVKTLVQATLISLAPLIAIPTLGQILKYAGG